MNLAGRVALVTGGASGIGLATARRMNALGINRGKSGNVSVRWRDVGFDGYLVTESVPQRRTDRSWADGVPSPGITHFTCFPKPDRLTDEEIVANCIVTMVGGQETTTNLIGNGLLTLLRHPAELAKLRGELREAFSGRTLEAPKSQADYTDRIIAASVRVG